MVRRTSKIGTVDHHVHRIWNIAGKTCTGTVYGVTNQTPDPADVEKLLTEPLTLVFENAGHHCPNWFRDEDRCYARTGCGPENVTPLRRSAIGFVRVCSLDFVPIL